MNQIRFTCVSKQTKTLYNMKKINLSLLIAIIASAFIFTACKQDAPAEEEIVVEEEVVEEGLSGYFVLDQESSSFSWLGKKVTGEHYGSFSISDGKFVLENGELTEGKVAANVRSLVVEDIEDAEMNAKLVGHLNSADFFNTEEFPEAYLTISGTDEEGRAYGTLTIKNISNDVAFDYEVDETKEGAVVTGTLVVDRTLYDIKYGSGKFFEDLGDKTIYDEFTLNFTAVGVAQ